MELFDKINKIIEKYDLQHIECGPHKNVYEMIKEDESLKEKFVHKKINDSYLCKKYKNNIPKGWYGFDIGTPINPIWMEIIDKIVNLCVKTDPNIELKQIKIKFGGIDFHVYSEVITDTHNIFKLISTKLRDQALIY